MYSELKHSKKLSKRLQRDSKFHDILYEANNKKYFEIEPGLREVKYLKDMESIFSDVSINDTIELYERTESAGLRERLRIKKSFFDYEQKKDSLLKERLEKLKWTNKKL